MDIRQLKYFVQIVESGSLSKASRQLHIVQPALSHQINKLETEVGEPLLIRSSRGIKTTTGGEALYQHAKFVLRQLDEAINVARQKSLHLQGRVALGLPPSTSAMLGLPLIHYLKQKYPSLILNITVALPSQLEVMARKGDLDIVVLFSNNSANELACESLFEEEIFAILASTCGLIPQEKQEITLKQVAQLPLVLAGPQHQLRHRLMLEFENARLKPKLITEIDSLQLMMRYALGGHAITLQSMAATYTVGLPESWRWMPISDVSIHRTGYLYTLPPHKQNHASAVVRDEIKHMVGRLIDDGVWIGIRNLMQIET